MEMFRSTTHSWKSIIGEEKSKCCPSCVSLATKCFLLMPALVMLNLSAQATPVEGCLLCSPKTLTPSDHFLSPSAGSQTLCNPSFPWPSELRRNVSFKQILAECCFQPFLPILDRMKVFLLLLSSQITTPPRVPCLPTCFSFHSISMIFCQKFGRK